MTPNGYRSLKAELERLRRVERPENIKAIEAARALGDLSENAEYHAAKERQGHLERRIGELEHKLASAEVIETDARPTDRAVFGSTVTLENVETGESVVYQLVGPDESDIENGRISITSPLGRAIIGKKPFDELNLQVPGGNRSYEVVEIN
jgi:transcription elongation factor GreA